MKTCIYYRVTFWDGGRERTAEYVTAQLARDVADSLRAQGKQSVRIDVLERREP